MVRVLNAAMDAFFDKWTLDTIAWFAKTQQEYFAEERARIAQENKDRAEGTRRPMKEYMDEWRAGQKKWVDQVGKGNLELIKTANLASIEKTVRQDMAAKKDQVYAKCSKKVGEITELDLHCGDDGTPNGRVTGTEGTAYISTIRAGGWNIQCLHYRVLVK